MVAGRHPTGFRLRTRQQAPDLLAADGRAGWRSTRADCLGQWGAQPGLVARRQANRLACADEQRRTGGGGRG